VNQRINLPIGSTLQEPQFVQMSFASANSEPQKGSYPAQVKQGVIPGHASGMPDYPVTGRVQQMLKAHLIIFVKMLVIPKPMGPPRRGEDNPGLFVDVLFKIFKKKQRIHQMFDDLKAEDIFIYPGRRAPFAIKITRSKAGSKVKVLCHPAVKLAFLTDAQYLRRLDNAIFHEFPGKFEAVSSLIISYITRVYFQIQLVGHMPPSARVFQFFTSY
jgi:hypothetical protein